MQPTLIEVSYNSDLGVWVADRPHYKPNEEVVVGQGKTPLEAVGDLVCSDYSSFNIQVSRKPMTRKPKRASDNFVK